MSQFRSKFYDLYTHPDDTAEMAAKARRIGYSGIVATNLKTDEETILPNDFAIYRGVDIKPPRIGEEIRKYRASNLVSIVKGEGEEINRIAVESEGLDILLQPGEFNNVLARAAADNSIAIGFNLGLLIRLRGDARIRELRNMRTNLKHARKYKLKMMITSDASSEYDLRSPGEMVALSGIFGMTRSEAIDSMSITPVDILRKKSFNYVREGIEII